MPRERVYDTITPSPDGEDYAPSGLEISWWPSRDGIPGHVQLGTGIFPERPGGVTAQRTGEDGEEPPLAVDQPRHVTVDRDGLNRAIRTLRRARDSAYGADA
jgi:hypothetical protein